MSESLSGRDEGVRKLFQAARKRLLYVSRQASLTAFDRISAYLCALQEALHLPYLSLTVFSGTNGMQSCFERRGDAYVPTPARPVPPYAVVHQMGEMASEDPDETVMHCSPAGYFPDDVQEIATAQGVSDVLLQALCSEEGQVQALLLMGSSDRALLGSNEWQPLHELIAVLLAHALRSSSLVQYVTFAEMLDLVPRAAAAVAFLSAWLPPLIAAPWHSSLEVSLAVLGSSRDSFVLYKAVQSRSRLLPEVSHKEAVSRSRSMSVQRLASTSRLHTHSMSSLATIKEPAAAPRLPGVAMTSIADLILPSATGVELPSTEDKSSGPRICVFKEMKLVGSLLESVVRNSCITSIPDVQLHVSEQPAGLPELLFNVDRSPPQAIIVLPLFCEDGEVKGALYLACHTETNLVWLQKDLEILLMIAGEPLLQAMQSSGTAARRSRRLQGFQRTLQQLVLANCEPTSLEPVNEGRAMSVLQGLLTGIIGSTALHTTPQVCKPEHIQIESVAGTGAFAVVYRGRLLTSDTLVAVKVMPLDQHMDDMMLIRNATELATLSGIRHHNVVQIIAQFPECVMLSGPPNNSAISFRSARPEDLRSADPPRLCCVVVMEFCTYGTLLNALQMDVFKHRNGMPNISSICSVLHEMASALSHLHEHGILHCDLKPQNVLLKADECSPRGFVSKLTDFGLARVVTRHQPLLRGDSAGTPSHLAPEIVKVGETQSVKTAKSDIYAFGIVMWELFSAQQAFWMVDKHAVLTHVVLNQKRLPFPSFANHKYVNLCERCWHTDMDERPSFDVIQRDLRDIMAEYAAQVRVPPSNTAPQTPSLPPTSSDISPPVSTPSSQAPAKAAPT